MLHCPIKKNITGVCTCILLERPILSLVKVAQQANHPRGAALELCSPHLVTQIYFYTRYTCVLVGSPKYVQ